MYDIAIIGAGQIGSRHLQAIAKLEGTARVHLADPSEESLRVARERFFEVYERDPGDVELVCSRGIDTVPESVDLAIVATCSNIRAGVVRELVDKKEVNNLILEKVLFQKEAEYYEIGELLKKNNIPTWVNCYMRSRDFYQKLREEIDPDQEVEMRVEGSLWGLGCNSIHFIDYFAYLTGCADFSFTASRLDHDLIDAKRPGFKEFSGELEGKNSHGHALILMCRDRGNDPIKITINNGSHHHEIINHIDHVIHSTSDGRHKTEQKASIPFQSQTTNRLVQQIRDHGDCDLTPYRDSMNLHLPLIKIFLDHIQNLSGKSEEICPIT
ncbi:MAG: Gfo/Idh/MocA family oxidoreductase [Deltaproteobacteria bacterium]|nr:Gfo/Idh/MocA family oxidoreductase [Deltaproteobacteria bacterium]